MEMVYTRGLFVIVIASFIVTKISGMLLTLGAHAQESYCSRRVSVRRVSVTSDLWSVFLS